MYQISAELKYQFVSYSDFFKCAKRQSKKKNKETKKQLIGLLTHILETLCTSFFKFGVLSPLVGGHLYSNFGINQVKDHGIMNA